MTYAVSKISAESPDMSDAEFAEFVADIRKNGQLVPIWVRGTEIVDGRKRFAACTQLGIKPKIVNLDPAQDADDVARALNVLRTHYSPSQRGLYGATREKIGLHGGNRKSSRINTTCSTIEQAAREVGVSPSYISKARQVVKHGAPELAEAVRAGNLTLNAARQIVVAVPKKKQAALAAKVLNGGEDVRRHRAQPKKPDEQFRRSISMLEVAVDVLMTNVPMVKRNIKRAEWLEALSDSRTTITHIIKALES